MDDYITVKDLMEVLQKFPKDMPVFFGTTFSREYECPDCYKIIEDTFEEVLDFKEAKTDIQKLWIDRKVNVREVCMIELE